LIAVFIIAFSCIGSLQAQRIAGKTRSECLVFWTFDNKNCGEVKELLEVQIQIWNETICIHDTDATCWYPSLLESGRGDMIETTHMTVIPSKGLRIKDDVWVHFMGSPDAMPCRVRGLSRAPKGWKRDSGTNYCNLYNLVVGAGLTEAEVGFREYTHHGLCSSLKGFEFGFLQNIMFPERNCCLKAFTGAGTEKELPRKDPTGPIINKKDDSMETKG
jgi:hypothetical protein